MDEEIKDNKNLYQCKECGLHYKNKDIAEKCEIWCKEHKTCNVEITGQAEENKKDNDNQGQSSFANASEDELSELKKKCEEYLNNWKREHADFLNYKKDEIERMGVLVKYTKEDIIFKILPILDNIQLAEQQLPEKLKVKAREPQINGSTRSSTEAHSKSSPQVEWTKGFLQIQIQAKEFLKKEGIEEIKATGQNFDPNIMEVVEEVALSSDLSAEDLSKAGALAKGEEIRSGTVIEELQKGYIMDGKVIRPAKVRITK